MSMRPPRSVYFTAFSTRFARTCRSRVASASTRSPSGNRRPTTRSPVLGFVREQRDRLVRRPGQPTPARRQLHRPGLGLRDVHERGEGGVDPIRLLERAGQPFARRAGSSATIAASATLRKRVSGVRRSWATLSRAPRMPPTSVWMPLEHLVDARAELVERIVASRGRRRARRTGRCGGSAERGIQLANRPKAGGREEEPPPMAATRTTSAPTCSAALTKATQQLVADVRAAPDLHGDAVRAGPRVPSSRTAPPVGPAIACQPDAPGAARRAGTGRSRPIPAGWRSRRPRPDRSPPAPSAARAGPRSRRPRAARAARAARPARTRRRSASASTAARRDPARPARAPSST